MSTNITTDDRETISKMILNGEELPQDLKHLLFPLKQKEYELVYAGKMRKEDILANEDGVFPVPIQIDKSFTTNNGEDFIDGWKNIIVYGDNLQFLKTIYSNTDPFITNKVKGRVKLIYIDPPFATESDFKGGKGQKAYNDKVKGAEFVEFLRRRLVLARELLSEDGSIFLHLDQKMCHQVRLIMDEVFGQNNFQNQIIWQGTSAHNDAVNKYGNVHQVIYWYGKSSQPAYYYDDVRDGISDANLKEYSKLELADGTVIPYKENENLEGNGNRRFRTVDASWKGTSKEKQFEWRGAKPNSKREWMYTFDEMEKALERGELYLTNPKKGAIRCLKRYIDENKGQILQDIWTTAGRMSGGKGTYPTEKPEVLLSRIIKSVTKPGELVLDFFGGSGTTAAVAEKLGRKWIVCDIGKYSYYTMQKRILTIKDSRDPDNKNKKYLKDARGFLAVQLGQYHLDKVLELHEEEYRSFVLDLFEVDSKKYRVAGYEFDGEKGEYPVKIFPYWNKEFSDVSIDKEYLENINAVIGKKQFTRIYIIAPANCFDFITDYHRIDSTKYYFLKIPYQMIKELHKIPFHKLRQPQSKNNVNSIDEIIGFHFIKQPEVKSRIVFENDTIIIKITNFLSPYYKDEDGNPFERFVASYGRRALSAMGSGTVNEL